LLDDVPSLEDASRGASIRGRPVVDSFSFEGVSRGLSTRGNALDEAPGFAAEPPENAGMLPVVLLPFSSAMDGFGVVA
jgi:hypothetical protein